MSRTIHGLSHRCLKAFRDKSASLSVYWIYVSRMNNEGVAWPSVAGLDRDTGWNKDTCLEARKHLVKIGALQEVEDYIRPEWRELPEPERKRKVSLDRSEYYRPTGYVILDGKKLPMLYLGSEEQSDIEVVTTDVRKRRTSKLSENESVVHRNCRTELDSPLDLDSISELDSSGKTNTSAPSGATPPKASNEGSGDKPKTPSSKPAPKSKEPKRLSYPRDLSKWSWDHFEQFATENAPVNTLAALYETGMNYSLSRLPTKLVAKRCVDLFQELQRNDIPVTRYQSLFEAGKGRAKPGETFDIFQYMLWAVPGWLKSQSSLKQNQPEIIDTPGLLPVQLEPMAVPPVSQEKSA